MTGVLHTAMINAIEVIVSSDKLIKMVNFKHKILSLKFTIFINLSESSLFAKLRLMLEIRAERLANGKLCENKILIFIYL